MKLRKKITTEKRLWRRKIEGMVELDSICTHGPKIWTGYIQQRYTEELHAMYPLYETKPPNLNHLHDAVLRLSIPPVERSFARFKHP
jgi:hypothetical protein